VNIVSKMDHRLWASAEVARIPGSGSARGPVNDNKASVEPQNSKPNICRVGTERCSGLTGSTANNSAKKALVVFEPLAELGDFPIIVAAEGQQAVQLLGRALAQQSFQIRQLVKRSFDLRRVEGRVPVNLFQ